MKRNPPWPGAYLSAALVASAVLAADVAVEVPVRSLLLNNSVVAIRAGEVLGSSRVPKGTLATKLEPLSDGWIAGGMRETPVGTDLYLLVRRGSESRELDVPIAEGSLLRGWATPVVRDGALQGLLWLEGERHNRLCVRSAERTVDGWAPAEAVSVPGPGSQVALSGVVLDDGSWLAVWTWVDASGDAETVWSVRRIGSFEGRGTWSVPARVHEDNVVHDVQPVLAAFEGGAVVVWTGFDGSDYRMRRAHFDGRSWTTTSFFGGRGASDPVFVTQPAAAAGAGRTSLMYTTVAPSTWSFLDFGARGDAVGTGSLEREQHDFGPVFLARDQAGVAQLVWPSFDDDFPERRRPVTFEPLARQPEPEE